MLRTRITHRHPLQTPPLIRRHARVWSHLVLAATFFMRIGTVKLHAQSTPAAASSWEFYGSAGWLIPTGAQKVGVKGADMTALIVSYVPQPSFAITGTFGWARSHARAWQGEPKLDVFTADVAAEARARKIPLGTSWKVAPFAALGMGARGYNIPSSAEAPTTNLSAYAGLGSELAWQDLRIRLELRDYVSRFKPLAGSGAAGTRNDLAILIGLRFAKQ